MTVLRRSRRRRRARSISAFAALLGMLLMSSGLALLVAAGPANATQKDPNCVEKAAYDEVVHHPAVTHDVVHPAVTHDVFHPAVPAVPDEWQNFAPNKDQETFQGPPTWPTDSRGTWEHVDKVIPPGHAGPDGVYQNGSGNGSWFYRHAGTPGQDAYTETVVDHEEYTETVVDHEAYNETIHHPAVECDDVEDVKDATADITVQAPGCTGNGSWAVTDVHNATFDLPGSGELPAGDQISKEFKADDGHKFADGSKKITVTKTIPQHEGTCPEPGNVEATPDVAFLDDCTTPTVFLPLPELARSAADSTVVTSAPTTLDINGVHYVVTGGVGPGQTATVTATPLEGRSFPSGVADPLVSSKTFKTVAQCTVVEPPVVTTVVSPPATHTKTVKPAKSKPAATTTTTSTTTIPSVVHAGLAGDLVDAATMRTQQGLALLVAGALVLMAGGLGMTRRTGAHT